MFKPARLLALASLLAFSVFSASAFDLTGKIIGGTAVSEGELPFVVALLKLNNGHTELYQQNCGGTLISPQWVVTAAHCVSIYEGDYSQLRVMAGATTLSDTTTGTHETRTVSQVYIHENYSSAIYDNDIALIRLSSPVTAEPIADVSTSTEPFYSVGTTAYSAGWGDMDASSSSEDYPTNMMKVALPVISWNTCYSAYGSSLTNNMVCAGYSEGGKDTCQGDSGGPLYVNTSAGKALIGVVSHGNGCAEPGYYGIYTKLQAYTSWIESKTGLVLNSSQWTSSLPSGTNSTQVDTDTVDYSTFTANIDGSSSDLQLITVGAEYDGLPVIANNINKTYGALTLKSALTFDADLTPGYSKAVVYIYIPDDNVTNYSLVKCTNPSNLSTCSLVDYDKSVSGHWLRYVLEDGGEYDEDGVVNGSVSDPVYVAKTSDVISDIVDAAAGGGCSASKEGSLFSFLIMISAVVLLKLKRRKEND